MIAAGSFREDLYYRLAEIVVRIPSLAERHGDAVLLAKHFLAPLRPRDEPAGQGPRARRAGGDRRLALAGQRPRAREPDEARRDHGRRQADQRRGSRPRGAATRTALPVNLKSAREQADRRAIRQALARTENNISSAAKLLGISRPTLYDLLKQYGLQP